MQTAQKLNYGQHRLLSIGLANNRQIYPSQNGRISIAYTHLDGTWVTYTPNRNSESVGIERHHRTYIRERLNPELYSDALAINTKNQRYFQVSKLESGIGSLPFFPSQVTDLYKSKTQVDVLAFTEGEIKAAVAAKKGLACVAFSGISVYKLCAETQDLIRTTQPKTIVIQYDSDCADKRNWKRGNSFYLSAYKFAQELLDFIKANKLEITIQICKGNNVGGKGLDDVIVSYPNEAVGAFKELKTNVLFTFETLTQNNLTNTLCSFFNFCPDWYKLEKQALRINGQGKFLDILAANTIKLNPEQFCNRTWIVPTGTGKSYAMIEFAKTFPSVILCPTSALCRDIANDAHKRGVDCFQCKPKSWGCLGEHLGKQMNPQLIVVCYQSFQRLADLLASAAANYHLFVDEAHNFTSASSKNFCLDNMRDILDNKDLFASFTPLTGTHLYNFDSRLSNYPITRIQVPVAIRKEVLFVECKETLGSVASLVARSLAQGRTPVVLLNSKGEKLDRLKDQLKQILPNTSFSCFNSTTKDNPTWIELLDTRSMPNDIEYFVTTSVLKEGNNVQNEIEFLDVIVATPLHAAELEQFAARFRNAQKVCLYLLKKEKKEEETTENEKISDYFNPLYKAMDYEHSFQKLCEHLNELGSDTPAFLCVYKDIRQGETPIKLDKNGLLEVCGLELSNWIFRQETTFLWGNKTAMLERLGEYGFVLGGVHQDSETLTPKVFMSAKERKQAKQATRKTTFDEAITALEGSIYPQEHARLHLDDNPFFEDFVEICKYALSNKLALELFKKTEGKKSDLKMLISRLRFAHHSKIVQQHATPLAEVIRATKRKIQAGKKYNPNEVRALFLECLELDSNTNILMYQKDKRNDKILKVLRLMFDCEKCDNVWTFQLLKLPTKTATIGELAPTSDFLYTFDS